jgi:pimeloyl-ACP methyl ester carboxylesterase
MWRDQLLDLGKDYRAVAPDMRGYNLSSKPQKIEDYIMHHLVEDMKEFVKYIGNGQKVILVGHDWGGVVAYPLVNRYPELFEKLIIINAPHPDVFARLLSKNQDQQTSSQYVLAFRRPGFEERLLADDCAALLGVIKTSDMEFTEDDKIIYLEGWQQPGAITGGLNYYRGAGSAPPTEGEKISEFSIEGRQNEPVMINIPTLVIWAEGDTALTVHNLVGLEEFVPDLTVKRIPKASHWVVNEQPDVINKMIREFIK